MDLRQLRYFIAIVEQGSISKAAQHLHIAQPALSQHIRHMEADIGVQLLHRQPRGITATEAGEKLLRHARLIVSQFEHAREDVRCDAAEPSGIVRFGLPGTVSQILSVPLIEAVKARFPRIKLRIAEAMSGFILDWLRDGTVDLGVLYNAGAVRGLAARRILSEELCLLAAPGTYPEVLPAGDVVEFERAARLDLVLPGQAHGLRQQLDAVAAERKIDLNVDTELEAYAQIKVLAERGFGATVLPRVAAKREIDAGTLKAWRITDPELSRDVYLARSGERPATRAVHAVEQACREILRDLVRGDAWTAVLHDHEPLAGD